MCFPAILSWAYTQPFGWLVLSYLYYLVGGTCISSVEQILDDNVITASPQPYSFSYVAGRYPGQVDRQHSETSDGNGVVRGCEAWVCQEKHKSKVNAPVMRYLRNVCGKTRMDRVSDEWVLKEWSLKENPIGSFAYVDPRHQIRMVEYVADKNGFHPVLSNPVADTPIVAAAKQHHADLFQRIAEEHARIAAERDEIAATADPNTLIQNNY
uniref:Uncharacterized protein n=1 Tax=Timema shepardi TaxID=629360 RepID=A0A7R9B034_TIMSH|nr:unnamed protein product [Timema shepardi]